MIGIFNIIRLLMIIVETMILIRFLDIVFTKKNLEDFKRFIIIGIWIISTYTIARLIPISPIKLILMALINSIACMSLYSTKLFRTLGAITLYILSALICETITFFILPEKQLFTTSDLIKKNILGILVAIISYSILFMGVNIISRWKILKKNKFNKIELLAYIAPISTIAIVKLIINYETNIYNARQQLIFVMITSVGLLLSNIFIWKIFEYMIEQDRQRMRYESMQEKIKKQYLYYRNIETKQEESKKMWHDINNHLSCIKVLIHSGHVDEASEYLSKIDATISRLRGVINTGNLITDAILNEKYDFARSNQIEMRIDIDLNEVNFIDNMDLCTIYSNLLDNAIEASNKLPKEQREVIVSTKVIKNFLVIKVVNNTIENVIIKNNRISTSKKDKNNHGIGIMNVHETIDKYNGSLTMVCKNNQFTTNILIPLP